MSLFDAPDKYGTVSRSLHWLMALGFAWMFLTAALHFFFYKSPASDALWPTHSFMGFTLLWLGILRLLWALVNHARRPPQSSLASRLGHGVIYLLMLAIPVLALLRVYGADRAFSYLGIPLMEPVGQKVPWMVDLAGLLHGELGWMLLALVAGHVAMVYKHRRAPGHTDVLSRML